MQAAYEEFGCNDGNVFFMGIDKGNTNQDVIYFNSTYGIQYPGVSGQNGGGNEVHLLYEIQATPSIVVIQPDRVIAVKQIWPPNTNNIVDSVSNAGGILQACLTNIQVALHDEDILTIEPNPVKDYTYLHLNLQSDKEIEINVYNLTGGKIMEFKPAYYPAGKYYMKADFTHEPEGFYFVQVLENSRVVTTKKLVLTQ